MQINEIIKLAWKYIKILIRKFDKTIMLMYLIKLYGILSCCIFVVNAIDCFKCVSMNWQNKECDDPFHNNSTFDILEAPCLGGRKGRDGVFPATSCVKIAGYFDDTDEHITIRGCALDSGTLTTDTEIVRMSHCGGLYYDGRYVHGCLQSCNDADACNSADNLDEALQDRLLPMVSTMCGIAIQYFWYRYFFK